MNMFDARLDQKYARVRVTNGLNGNQFDIQLPFKDLSIEVPYGDNCDSSKDAIEYLLEEAGYKVIFL